MDHRPRRFGVTFRISPQRRDTSCKFVLVYIDVGSEKWAVRNCGKFRPFGRNLGHILRLALIV